MIDLNITNFNLEVISFEQVYNEELLKWALFVTSSLSSFVTIPLLYGVVWYERNRHYRTLINQLAASICLYMINWMIFTHLFAISHMISGSAGSFQCSLELLVLNVTAMQVVFMIIAIIVSKYVFVFHLKNPLAIQEDFFYFFISMATFAFTLVSQLTFAFLPGKNLVYYICVGSFLAKTLGLVLPLKFNYPVYLLMLLTVIIHVVTGIKLKKAKKHSVPILPQQSGTSRGVFRSLPSKKYLAGFTTNVISVIVITIALSSFLLLNKLNILEVTKYRNIVLIYFWHWCVPQLLAICTIVVYYRGQKQLVNDIFKVAKSYLLHKV